MQLMVSNILYTGVWSTSVFRPGSRSVFSHTQLRIQDTRHYNQLVTLASGLRLCVKRCRMTSLGRLVGESPTSAAVVSRPNCCHMCGTVTVYNGYFVVSHKSVEMCQLPSVHYMACKFGKRSSLTRVGRKQNVHAVSL